MLRHALLRLEPSSAEPNPAPLRLDRGRDVMLMSQGVLHPNTGAKCRLSRERGSCSSSLSDFDCSSSDLWRRNSPVALQWHLTGFAAVQVRATHLGALRLATTHS